MNTTDLHNIPMAKVPSFYIKSLLILFVILLFAVTACNEAVKIEDRSSKNMMTGSNAELAIIMRKIHEDAKKLKKEINSADDLAGHAPEYLQNIIGAETTDSTVEGPLFDAFAESYINNIQAIYADTTGAHKDLYNAAIATCVECHGEFCPGPVKTIEKLYIH